MGKTPKIMFASHTPVFSNLMAWAGLITNSVSSSNRWLNGNISAQTKLKVVPNYLFMPDPEKNDMITREALRQKIPIITITNSDSVFTAGIVLIGNNRTFKYTSQLTEMVVRFLQVSYVRPQAIPQYKECLTEMSWFRSRKFSYNMEHLGS